MISFKDLQNKVYSGKQCVRFEVAIQVEDKTYVLAQFTKVQHEHTLSNEWNMRIILNRTRDKDTEVYNFGYIMPRDNLPLELIAATGLRYMQLYLKGEIQHKSNMDFAIGELVSGM